MINTVTPQINRSEGIQETIRHSIKNKAVIFNILRKQLYSKPELAVLREYSTNGVDIHKRVGKSSLPIRVTLPTMLDAFVRIRDFGTGLDNAQIEELYSGYGASDKRNSNEEVGFFGIGKFSAFSTTDSFIINSYKNGFVHSWNSFIDTTQDGAISLMGSAPSNEPEGLEIVVPVKSDKIDTFHREAVNLFSYFDLVPELINATDADKESIAEIKNRVPIIEGNGYKFFGQRNSKIVMGGIPYSIDASAFNNDEISEIARAILNEGVVLYFGIGDLSITPSRETLSYDTSTKKKLISVLDNIAKDFIAKGNQAFTNCKTLWEAKCLYNTVFGHEGGLYRFKSFLQKQVSWNGQKISDIHFLKANQTGGAKCDSYHSGWKRGEGRIERIEHQVIDANPKHIVIENDLNIENGVKSYIISLLMSPLNNPTNSVPPYTRVYLVTFKDAATKAAWLKDSEFDGPMTLLSSYPKKKLTDYYGSTATGGTKNAKHQTREFTLNLKHTSNHSTYGCRGRRGSNIEYFDTCDVDVSTDSGIYVLIDSFTCQDAGHSDWFNTSPRELISELNQVSKICGVAIPTIYAFKRKHADEVKKNKNMVNVYDWMKGYVTTYFTDVKEQTKIANWLSIEAAKRECYGLNYFEKLKNFQADPKSDIASFLTYVRVLFKKDGQDVSETEQKKNLAEKFGIKTKDFKATVDIKSEYQKVETKYPLLFNVVNHIGYDSSEVRKTIVHLESYVAMIDEKENAQKTVTASVVNV